MNISISYILLKLNNVIGNMLSQTTSLPKNGWAPLQSELISLADKSRIVGFSPDNGFAGSQA
jgi:hypothetical protein